MSLRASDLGPDETEEIGATGLNLRLIKQPSRHVRRIPIERAIYLAKHLSKERPPCLKGVRPSNAGSTGVDRAESRTGCAAKKHWRGSTRGRHRDGQGDAGRASAGGVTGTILRGTWTLAQNGNVPVNAIHNALNEMTGAAADACLSIICGRCLIRSLPAPAQRLARSKRSRFITLSQAATKSWTNFFSPSAHA